MTPQAIHSFCGTFEGCMSMGGSVPSWDTPGSLLTGKLPPTLLTHSGLCVGDDSALAVLCTETSGLFVSVVLSDLF